MSGHADGHELFFENVLHMKRRNFIITPDDLTNIH